MQHTRLLGAAAALAATAALLAPVPALADGRPFSTDLAGINEPGGGDPDGSGTAHVWVNVGLSEVCYHLVVSALDPVVGAHIHSAPAGVNGPVVVPLGAPVSGTSSGCVAVEKSLAKAILKSPQAFYVNVHTTVYPGGAIRGQLG
ncbi:CHRD domain-containing protein [Intrasporangium calvum]|uniref:CHRD domain-containing protein n=1 Tax=Intrasporangium calvum TaxID=53358 RepID=A0ABT5GEG9_9MICO|nr:CHRD domain-containing protein [Intrasporangium calvum]MDC5696638.1 CHRD domain-containing protein [Intrasporangium calvum]